MDAIVMLREDHAAVKKLFTKFEKGDTAVMPLICDALDRHAALEETYFYPEVKDVIPGRDLVLESIEEHHVVHMLIGELRSMSPDDETYRAKGTVLIENVKHHIEEEESELFPAVREALGRTALQDLGQRMSASPEAQA
jgi:hemerythrin superfamily protein